MLGSLLAPLFPLPVSIPQRAFIALPLVATVVGLLASLVGLRRAVKVSPSAAFGGAMTGLPDPGVAADLVVSDLTVEYPAGDYVGPAARPSSP